MDNLSCPAKCVKSYNGCTIGIKEYCTYTSKVCCTQYRHKGYNSCTRCGVYSKQDKGPFGSKNCYGLLCYDTIIKCNECKPTGTKSRNVEPCIAAAVNVELSTIITVNKKIIRANEAIDTIKNTINSDIKLSGLFPATTYDQYTQYFSKLSKSALSLSNQKLLLEQMTSEFVDENTLNLYGNIQYLLAADNQSYVREQIKEAIIKTMKTVLTNIITSYNYGEDFLQMNYASAYQTMYYSTSLQIAKWKWKIIGFIKNTLTVKPIV